jgi:hypothetical protein
LKSSKEKSEDELTRSIEENDALKGALVRLKEEMKEMQVKQDSLLEEVAELTNLLKCAVLHPDQANASEIIRRIFPESKQFPPSMKNGKLRDDDGGETDNMYDIPDGIIAQLTRECGGNVHDHLVVDVTSGSFEKETNGANPHSGTYDNKPMNAAKNVADLKSDSIFHSACRLKIKDIPHTRNNWICYNFKERRIVPTHYTIRTNSGAPGGSHLKTWLVETSADGESWREVAREENNRRLNGRWFTATFAVAGGEECRFIRLVNIGRNHSGYDIFCISAWEIFGNLFK